MKRNKMLLEQLTIIRLGQNGGAHKFTARTQDIQ